MIKVMFRNKLRESGGGALHAQNHVIDLAGEFSDGGKTIALNLDGIDIQKVLTDQVGYTNSEIRHILGDKKNFYATRFFKENTELTLEDLGSLFGESHPDLFN